MTIKIAVIQQNGNPGRVDENRAKALSFAADALAQGADVILFHEELLVGYVENLKALAEPLHGPTTQAFQALLRGTHALVIYGLTERDDAGTYIAAPVVSGQGVIANYRKTHLWWAAEGLRHEPSYYKAGDRLVTFDVLGTMLRIDDLLRRRFPRDDACLCQSGMLGRLLDEQSQQPWARRS